MNWNIYIHQALFAFHAYLHSRLGTTPFYLQYRVEPILPSTSIVSKSVTQVEITEVAKHCQKHVLILEKYRFDMQDKYYEAMK